MWLRVVSPPEGTAVYPAVSPKAGWRSAAEQRLCPFPASTQICIHSRLSINFYAIWRWESTPSVNSILQRQIAFLKFRWRFFSFPIMHIVAWSHCNGQESITVTVTAKWLSGITQFGIDSKMRSSSWWPTLITSLILANALWLILLHFCCFKMTLINKEYGNERLKQEI